MKCSAFDGSTLGSIETTPRKIDQWCRRLLFSRLERIQHGTLTITDGQESGRFGTAQSDYPLSAAVRVYNPRFYTRVISGGVIGAAESYMDGDWITADLTTLCRILARNRDALSLLDKKLRFIAGPALQIYHAWNRNSRTGSRRNIAAHYDLGNDFFETFLDETMAYSSGYYENEDDTLLEASTNKFDRLCQKLALKSTDHVLEIGSGWGGFACHAAKKFGCKVTTVTISREQLAGTQKRIEEGGLGNLVEARYCDYRDIEGRFDKIASIEMIEAVGHQYYGTFMKKCMALLKEDGLLGLQAITIRDQHYRAARRNVDFIKRYVFPGGCLPSHTTLCNVATAHTDFVLSHVEDMTSHYARTLSDWRERFLANETRVASLGYSEGFRRMWHFYLCYCEAGFEERLTGVSQLVFARPDYRVGR